MSGILDQMKSKSDFDSIYKKYNDTNRIFSGGNLLGLFKNTVKNHPQNIAVKNGTNKITYGELDKESDKIANYLCMQGIQSKENIGVVVAREINTIILILGILKLNCAYVPIEEDYPDERKTYILKNSKCNIMITSKTYEEVNSMKIYDYVFERNQVIEDSDLAYTIYTSGSTGTPKGVEISHKAVTNTIQDIIEKFDITKNDRILALSSMCFDLSIFDIFGAITVGATIVQIDDQRDVSTIRDTIEKEKITIWNSIPSTMELLLNNTSGNFINRSLRLVLLSGDWISLKTPSKINMKFPNAKIISLGGATEASIWSIYYPIKNVNNEWKSIPYGYPLSNQQIYILNFEKKLCPYGIEGEIFIGGIGLANGYANDFEKTDKAFIQHETLGRLYQTGDYGVFTKEGYVIFLGRKDNQVKLNGYRIELGEIESIMNKFEEVEHAAVAIKKNSVNCDVLCGYYVMDEKYHNDLLEFMKTYLPHYMMPTEFIKMETLPLTANGKLDRRSLPEIVVDKYSMRKNDEVSPLEEKLLILFEKIYNSNIELSIYDNFFEIGLNSILMVNVITEIENQFSIKIKFKEFLKANNIHELAELMNKSKKLKDSNESNYKISDTKNLYEPFPISDVQMAYFMGRDTAFEMGGTSTHAYGEIETDLNMELFNNSLQKVIDRHPILKSIVLENGTQKILKKVDDYIIKIEDLSSFSEKDFEKKVMEERSALSHHIFKTDEWPLFAFKAFKSPRNTHYLFIELDLLIGDGMSMRILISELMKFYNDPDLTLPKLNYTFRDYMIEMNSFKQTDSYKEAKNYWLNKLDTFPSAPTLPYKLDPGKVEKPHFARVEAYLDEVELENLRNLFKKNNVTLSSVICTAFSKVLAFWSNQNRLGINLTVFNRQQFHPDVKNIIGDFTSTMLLDINFIKSNEFWKQCLDVQNILMEALEYRDYNGVEFVRELSKSKHLINKAIMPIVFTSMIFDNTEEKSDYMESLGVTKYEGSQTSQVYLDFQASDDGGVLKMSWDYVKELFDENMINSMFSDFLNLLKNIQIDSSLLKLEVNNATKEFIKNYNNTANLDIKDNVLYQSLYQNSIRYANKIAVKDSFGQITYAELNKKSNQFAHYLINKGIGKKDIICIETKREINTIIMVYGILKSGAAYVPIDPEYPLERIDYIRDKCKSKFFINESFLNESLGYSEENLEICNQYNDLAYIIFTSGSTGNPKGVSISHSAAMNTILDINKKFSVNENDTILGISSMCFDLSIYDIFGIHSAGGKLILIEDAKDINKMIEVMVKEKVTIHNSVPAIMGLICSNTIDRLNFNLRLVLLSGDWIPIDLPDRIKKIFGNINVISLGGATEASIWSIYYPIGKVCKNWNSIPYGFPLTNQSIFILNDSFDFCPINVQGEIYISGKGIAKGYHEDERLTEKSFLNHPSLGRIYKTGDFGLLSSKGYIEFLGRKDNQVKIGGYRIELEEIKSKILHLPEIKEAVVLALENEKEKYLCAFICKSNDISNNDIKKILNEKLPDYMVPNYYVDMEKIPLTDNGKVDEKLLRLYSLDKGDERKICIKARNTLEQKIYEIWRNVLNIDNFSVKDDFYSLGGHSIKMINILSDFERLLQVKITYKEFINNCTVEKLASFLNEKKNEKTLLTTYPKLIHDDAHKYEEFPLTEIQMSYLVGRNTSLDSGGVSTHMYTEIRTELDMKKLSNALDKTIMKHDMLRAIILTKGKQKILNTVPRYDIKVQDISTLTDDEQKNIIYKKREKLENHIFQTDTWPLFNFEALKLNDNENYLFVEFDQLIADGTSIQIITKDLLSFYYDIDKEIDFPNISFRDYMMTYETMKTTTKYIEDKKYWMEKLMSFPSAPNLTIRQSNIKDSTKTFKRLTKKIDESSYNLLKIYASEKKLSVSTILCAAYSKVLSTWSNQESIALNLTYFNRYPFHDDVDKIVGDFTSVLLLDINFSKCKNYVELSKSIADNLADAMEHQSFEGVEFIRKLAKRDNVVNQPVMPIVFTSMLFGENFEKESNLGEQTYMATQTSQVYLDHQANDMKGYLELTWDYVSEVFDEDMIRKMFDSYITAVSEILLGNDEFEVPSTQCENSILNAYNETSVEFKNQTLLDLFSDSCKQNQNNIAIIDTDIKITYGELNKEANKVANFIRKKIGNKAARISVIGYRDYQTIAAILGILKTGSAYVPIDPIYPEERKKYIYKNSMCNLEIDVQRDQKLINDQSVIFEQNIIDYNSLAYIIYTSGSTGNPKGVMISNKSAVNTILDINYKYKVNSKDRVAGISSLCFDLSVYDVFGTFAAGAALVIIKDQRNVQDLVQNLNKHNVTIWNSVPAIMEMATQYVNNTMYHVTYDYSLELNTIGTNKKDIYYWSPLAFWKSENGKISINEYEYEYIERLFPEIYFFTQTGKTREEIENHFKEIPKNKLDCILKELVDNEILIDSIIAAEKLFSSQDKLHQHEYGQDLLFKEDVYNKFKKEQLNRSQNYQGKKISLISNYIYPNEIVCRESIRDFETNIKISFEKFSAAISIFGQRVVDNKIKYNYSSAGGLYPIDLYIYIKEERIEGLDEGLYYFNPIEKNIEIVKSGKIITTDAHYFTNKAIFKNSAFSLYFVYNSSVSMPRYGGAGYEYAFIDTGIMTELFTHTCQYLGLGVCSIGDMNFEKIKDMFELNKNQVWIHTVECGLKKNSNVTNVFPILEEAVKESMELNTLRLVLLSGDWIPLDLPGKIKEIAPTTEIVSLGGATEASIWSIYFPIKEINKNWNSIPYGYPLANQKIYVMDFKGNLLPLGVKGEIFIGGLGVGLGYCNNEKGTKEQFILHPKYGILYRTGDYGLMNKNGYVVFLGRMDHQVKVNGYRIELEEIEKAIKSIDSIEECIVATQNFDGNVCLIAYYCSSDNIDVSIIIDEIGKLLPSYMIPKYFMRLNKFELTDNGKINRKSLPSYKAIVRNNRETIRPKTSLEIDVCKLISHILNFDEISLNDDFFEIGGDSLKATELIAAIENEFSIKIGFEIFSKSRVSEIVELIKYKSKKYEEGVEDRKMSCLNLIKKGIKNNKKVFLFSDIRGEIDQYNKLITLMNLDYSYYGVVPSWYSGIVAENISIREIAECYAKEILNETNEDEQIILIGWSFGGLLAYSVLSILENHRKIDFVCIIDSLHPEAELDKTSDFSLQNEKEIICNYVDPNFNFENINDISDLWKKVIVYFEKNNNVFEKFKTSFGELSFIIQDSNPKETIRKFNLFRTLSNAQSNYETDFVSKSKTVLIKATKSYIGMDQTRWKRYFNNVSELTYDTDHLGIIQEESIMNDILSKFDKCLK